jgi:hypothetical protein
MEGVEGARCGAAREWPNMAGGAASWGINGGVAGGLAGGASRELDGSSCNILGCEARNRENTEVCIAFMHRKSEKFSRF